jgi:hypothetical protein
MVSGSCALRQDGRHSAVALLLKAALIQVSDYRLLGASGLMKQYSFKSAGRSIKKNISTFCQVSDQLLQQKSDRYFLSVFNYVVFIDFYEKRSFC